MSKKIEYCPFGYWIGPNGEIEGISHWQNHDVDALEIAKKHGVDYRRHYEGRDAVRALQEAGWSTMTVNQYLLNPTIHMAYPTAAQAEAFCTVLREHTKHIGDDLITIGYDDFHSLASAVQHICQERDRGIQLGENPPVLKSPRKGLGKGLS